jgi:hypothetical protein
VEVLSSDLLPIKIKAEGKITQAIGLTNERLTNAAMFFGCERAAIEFVHANLESAYARQSRQLAL